MNSHLTKAIEKMVQATIMEHSQPFPMPDYKLKINDLDDDSCYVQLWLPPDSKKPAAMILDTTTNVKTDKRFFKAIKDLVLQAVSS